MALAIANKLGMLAEAEGLESQTQKEDEAAATEVALRYPINI